MALGLSARRVGRWMFLVAVTAAPVSAQNVALRGPAPVSPGIDAPSRRLPETKRLRPPHEEAERPGESRTYAARTALALTDVRPTAGASLPLLNNFEGAAYDGHSLDFAVAAGPRHLILATNQGLALKEKNGTVIAAMPGMTAFFDSVRAPQEIVGDPRVAYDFGTERFFVVAIGVRSSACVAGTCIAHFFVAVSKGSTPAGLESADWYFYALDSTLDGSTPTTRWADYVQLGLNDAVVVLTARMHPFRGGSPSTNKIRILDKALLVRGQPVSWTDFVGVKDPSSGVSGFAPAIHIDRTDRFFLLYGCWSSERSAVTVLEIRDALSSPALSFQSIPMSGWRSRPWIPAPQPGGTPLYVGGAGTVVYRNNSLWNAESTVIDTGDADVNGVLWYQIDVGASPGAAATAVQMSVLGEANTHYFSPALIVDEADNMAMLVGRSSAEQALSLYYTGRVATDPAGSLRTPAPLKEGSATLSVEEDRVGDYYDAALDAADGSAWLVGQIASAPNETTSWVGNVGLPGYAGRRLLPDQSITSPSGRMRLVYRPDGNLMLYDEHERRALWSSGTSGTAPGCAILKIDGNLVVNDRNGDAQWSSGTNGHRNARLVVQDDGNLEIVAWDGRTIWDRFRGRR